MHELSTTIAFAAASWAAVALVGGIALGRIIAAGEHASVMATLRREVSSRE